MGKRRQPVIKAFMPLIPGQYFDVASSVLLVGHLYGIFKDAEDIGQYASMHLGFLYIESGPCRAISKYWPNKELSVNHKNILTSYHCIAPFTHIYITMLRNVAEICLCVLHICV